MLNTQAREEMGNRVREARIAQALSQADLARGVGVSAPHIQEIEEGLIVPELEIFVEICNALSLWPDYALGRSKINVYNGVKTLN